MSTSVVVSGKEGTFVDNTPSANGYVNTLSNGELQYVGSSEEALGEQVTSSQFHNHPSISIGRSGYSKPGYPAPIVHHLPPGPTQGPPATPPEKRKQSRFPDNPQKSSIDSSTPNDPNKQPDSKRQKTRGLDVDWNEAREGAEDILSGSALILGKKTLQDYVMSKLPSQVGRAGDAFGKRMDQLYSRVNSSEPVEELEGGADELEPLLGEGAEDLAIDVAEDVAADAAAGVAEAVGAAAADVVVGAVGAEAVAGGIALAAAAAPVLAVAAGVALIGLGAYEIGQHVKIGGESINQHISDVTHGIGKQAARFEHMVTHKFW